MAATSVHRLLRDRRARNAGKARSAAAPPRPGAMRAKASPIERMRSLVRAVIREFPATARLMPGGVDRSRSDDIASFLLAVARMSGPLPEWGVPDGPDAYLAELRSHLAGI